MEHPPVPLRAHPTRTRRRRRPSPVTSHRGATLIESLIVLTIIAILLSTAIPSFTRFLSNHRVAVATNDLIHAIALTRVEALKRGRSVMLAPRGAHWTDGWAIFVDLNGDRRYDDAASSSPDETILVHDPLPKTLSITKPTGVTNEPFTDNGAPRRAYLMYDPGGYPRQKNGALSFGSFLLVDRTGGAVSTRTICVGSYGRVRVVLDRPTC